ncbi:MAG: carboxypeptidase-like regulatory domain-containing protein [Bacteroidota bacterium]
MTTRIYICFLVCMMHVLAWGQGLSVQGTVSSAEDGEPLAGASIVLLGGMRGAITDAQGKFQINLQSAADSLQISYYGYLSQVIKPGAQQIDLKLALRIRNGTTHAT